MTSPVTLDPNVHTRIPSSQTIDNNQILTQLQTLASQIPKLILDQVVAAIKELTGIDLTSWENLLLGIGGELGFVGSDFQSFIAEGRAVLTSITTLIEGGGATSTPGFPFTFPHTFIDTYTDNPVVVFINRLLQFLNPINWLEDGWNAVSAAITFAESVLKPTNVLAWLDPTSGVLPDSLAPAIITAIENSMTAAFGGIPIVGSMIASVFNVINGLLGIGLNATSQVAALAAQINGSNVPGGVSFVDYFNRADAINSLGSNYDQFYYGGGGGQYGIVSQKAHWTPGGTNTASCLNRATTPLTTNYQSATLVLAQQFTGYQIANAAVKLKLRMDSGKQNWVEAQIKCTGTSGQVNVQIGYVVGGVYTLIESFTNTLSSNAGDKWEFRAGTADNAREYVLLLNDVIVADCVESGTNSMLDPTIYKYPAFDVVAGLVVTFFIFFQVGMPDISAFAASDRAPT